MSSRPAPSSLSSWKQRHLNVESGILHKETSIRNDDLYSICRPPTIGRLSLLLWWVLHQDPRIVEVSCEGTAHLDRESKASMILKVPDCFGQQLILLQHKGAPFSLLIPGNRLHLVSSKEHWNDLNNASIDHLSSHAWSKQHFQPKHTFGYEWPDRRAEEGMPVVRAIRTLSNQFAELKKKFVVIMRDELNEALDLNSRPDGLLFSAAP